MESRHLRSALRAAATACALLALTACATRTAPGSSSLTSAPPSGAPAAEASDMLSCMGTEVPRAAIDDPRPATELGAAAVALDGHDVPAIDPADWIIASESSERVVLVHELDVPEDLGAGDIRDYEIIVVSTELGTEAPGDSDWMLMQSSSCALSRDLGELSFATVTLDPASPPDPGQARLSLLVTERACNSGENAAGRVELVELVESDATVEIVLGVRPKGGMHTCPSNPATPFTVELDRPLRERSVLNATVVPTRPISVPGTH